MQIDRVIRIAVCDDRQADLEKIAAMSSEILREAGAVYSIAEYETGASLLDALQKGAHYHIFLLDVMMEGMDGIELAAELRRQENKNAIIFISINREMALCGYEVSAARYLAKPLDPSKLKEALLHCLQSWQAKKEILLPTEQGQHRTSFPDIQFVEAFDRGTRFILADEIVESRLKFSEAEAMLPKSDFLLCHRAFLVNLACVKTIRNYEFTLKSGRIVPIGKGRYSEIHKRFVDFITN